jgi:hypothetical protein
MATFSNTRQAVLGINTDAPILRQLREELERFEFSPTVEQLREQLAPHVRKKQAEIERKQREAAEQAAAEQRAAEEEDRRRSGKKLSKASERKLKGMLNAKLDREPRLLVKTAVVYCRTSLVAWGMPEEKLPGETVLKDLIRGVREERGGRVRHPGVVSLRRRKRRPPK